MNKVVNVGQAKEEDIARWKKENPDGIFLLTVTDKKSQPHRKHYVYMRNPTIEDLNVAAGCATKDKPFDYFKSLVTDIQIGGSEEASNSKDSKLYLNLIETLKDKIDGDKGEILDL